MIIKCLMFVPSSVLWKCQPHLYHCQQKESGSPATSRAHGWKEVQPEEVETSCHIGRTPTSLSQCVMSQQWHRELMWGLPFARNVLTLTCTLLASMFIRSDKHEGKIPVSLRIMGLWLWSLCIISESKSFEIIYTLKGLLFLIFHNIFIICQ